MSLYVAVIVTQGDRFIRSVWRACVLLSACWIFPGNLRTMDFVLCNYKHITCRGGGGFSLIEMDVNFPLYIEPGEFPIHFCQRNSFI